MALNLNIIPYLGTDSLRFGMHHSELERVLGSPNKIDHNRRNELCFDYASIIARFGKTGLCEITFISGNNRILLSGIDLFADPNALIRLIELDGSPYEYVGFIFLLKIGLMLSGYHDGELSQKAVTIFEQGRVDDLRDKLRVFKIRP